MIWYLQLSMDYIYLSFKSYEAIIKSDENIYLYMWGVVAQRLASLNISSDSELPSEKGRGFDSCLCHFVVFLGETFNSHLLQSTQL